MKRRQRLDLVLAVLEEDGNDRLVSTRELAERLGVSEMTVRRDLSELAQEGLIHRIHGGATSLRQRGTPLGQRGQVGIILTSMGYKYTDPFFSAVLQGADKKLQKSGYRIGYILSYADIYTKEQVRDLLGDNPVDAILLIGTRLSEGVNYLKQNVRVLVSTTYPLSPKHDAILMDGCGGIRALVDHLVHLGRRRLGYITGYYDSRQQGFAEGIKANNLPDEPELQVALDQNDSEDWTPQMGQRGTASLMNLKKPPDAIVCASDRLAFGAMQWLHQNGFRVPQDISVTGYDNIPDAEFTIPPLTTVHVYKELLGALAAERAVRRIEDPNEVPLQIMTPTSAVIRQSCGAAG
jgi:DNA-binding LacI/PurR family transcriptional regulator